MRNWKKALVSGGLTLALVVPAGVAVAATTSGGTANPNTSAPVCNGDHVMLRLHDGTGWRHVAGSTQASGGGYQHKSGPQDGSGPRAAPALDGTGQQWRAGR